MKTPYTIIELDALIRACIDFTDQHGEYFYTGNIAGREGVSPDDVPVRRMMDWVAETDKGLLEYRGFAQDNVEYFRLGLDAKRIMSNGGFKWYLRSRAQKEYLERARMWAPIFISLLALIVSFLALQIPKDSARKIDDLSAKLNALRSDQDQTRAMVTTIRANVDTISSRLRKQTRTSR